MKIRQATLTVNTSRDGEHFWYEAKTEVGIFRLPSVYVHDARKLLGDRREVSIDLPADAPANSLVRWICERIQEVWHRKKRLKHLKRKAKNKRKMVKKSRARNRR